MTERCKLSSVNSVQSQKISQGQALSQYRKSATLCMNIKKAAGMCNLLFDTKETAESTEQRPMTEKAEAYSSLCSAKLNKKRIEKETLEMLLSDKEETKGSLIGLEDEKRHTRRSVLRKVMLDGGITGMPTKGNPELKQDRLEGTSTTESIRQTDKPIYLLGLWKQNAQLIYLFDKRTMYNNL